MAEPDIERLGYTPDFSCNCIEIRLGDGQATVFNSATGSNCEVKPPNSRQPLVVFPEPSQGGSNLAKQPTNECG